LLFLEFEKRRVIDSPRNFPRRERDVAISTSTSDQKSDVNLTANTTSNLTSPFAQKLNFKYISKYSLKHSQQKKLERLLLIFVTTTNVALSVIHSNAFRLFVAEMNSQFRIPSMLRLKEKFVPRQNCFIRSSIQKNLTLLRKNGNRKPI
jgi:hypothetical protein